MGNPMTPFFVPQTTSVIKSVQSGSVNIAAGSTSTNLTLTTEVVFAKSFAIFNGVQTGNTNAYSQTATTAATSSGSDFTAIRLTSSNNLSVTRQGASVQWHWAYLWCEPVTYYTVVEYN
jgi:hypothetical protein